MATSALPPSASHDGQTETRLDFSDNRLLIDLCGEFDRNLAEIENELGVHIQRRGNEVTVLGNGDARQQAEGALRGLYARLESGRPVEPGDVAAAIRFGGETGEAGTRSAIVNGNNGSGAPEIRTRKKPVGARTKNQADYIRALQKHDLVFGLGPAGTGKTYLAVAVGVSMFLEGRVDRILLSRPAIEAGERLGFLPGDMKDKVDPYMRPLYDALHDFLPARQLGKLMDEKRIEIAPLAFMRGRTLTDAFVVLDEAQNATGLQMKMFLTRLGEGARMAVTGDMTQIDLPRGQTSGLIEAEHVLRDVKGIGWTRFTSRDVVRHPMVARIVNAYDKASKKHD